MSKESGGCPNCKTGRTFKDNNGIEHDLGHSSFHVLLHSLKGHVHPVMIGLAVVGMMGRLLFPKTLTCTSCGHTFKV